MSPSDVSGKRFGLLTALSRSGTDRQGNAGWNVRCDCGVEKTVALRNLMNRGTWSCGSLVCRQRVGRLKRELANEK